MIKKINSVLEVVFLVSGALIVIFLPLLYINVAIFCICCAIYLNRINK